MKADLPLFDWFRHIGKLYHFNQEVIEKLMKNSSKRTPWSSSYNVISPTFAT
jgi:hypothetical protein